MVQMVCRNRTKNEQLRRQSADACKPSISSAPGLNSNANIGQKYEIRKFFFRQEYRQENRRAVNHISDRRTGETGVFFFRQEYWRAGGGHG